MSEICNRLIAANKTRLLTEYVPTPRNGLAIDFLKGHNFIEISNIDDMSLLADANLNSEEAMLFEWEIDHSSIPNIEIYNKEA